jgi:integrase
MLTLYRRHLEGCRHSHEGRAWTKCGCPIHCDGRVKGRRVRESMETVNWDRARRRMAELEDELTGAESVSRFLRRPKRSWRRAASRGRTGRKYNRIMNRLKAFAAAHGLTMVDQITLEHLDHYRGARELSPLSWSKELQLLRTFFGFCMKRKWCEDNPANDMDMPPDPKPKPREPYTLEEVTRIIAACQTYGKAPYVKAESRALTRTAFATRLRLRFSSTVARSRTLPISWATARRSSVSTMRSGLVSIRTVLSNCSAGFMGPVWSRLGHAR